MKLLLFLVLFSVGITYVNSHKILMVLAFASKSHRNVFDPVAEELAKRGNQVTIMSSIKSTKNITGITQVYLKETAEIFDNANMSFFHGTGADQNFLNTLVEMVKDVCRGFYQDPEVSKVLKNPKAFPFDVVIIDAIFNEFALPLGHYLGSSNIIFSPGGRFSSIAWDMNIPHPISYLPSGMDENTDRMTFMERFRNIFANIGFHYLRHRSFFPNHDEIVAEFIPNSPTIGELENKVSFLITNTHPAISHPMPSMPYSLEAGCLNCHPAKPLPKELEDFMQSSGDAGVIYFSLGSVTKGNSMPLEMRDKVIKAFSKLPQKILWKYEESIDGLPKNIKLIKWAPQEDLLEHSKLRLFITHGGGLSTSEAVYHKCPVLGFPLSADQWGNMATAAQRGFAEYLDWRTFTVESFLEKINIMLTKDSYQNAADHYSAILRDHPQPPVETAAYWIEYVARHKGAPHLKSAAENLNFFQYFLLDVIGVILLAIITVLSIIGFALCKVCRILFRNKANVSNKKKTN